MNNKKYTHVLTILSMVLFASMSFGITSCSDDNSETNDSGTGEKITVGLSSNLFNGGDNDAALTKSEKVPSYTTVATSTEYLSGSLMLESSLQEENQSSTKAVVSFATGTRIRVLACKTGTTTVESYGDFTVVDASSDPQASDNHTLLVDAGTAYDFYFITYNISDSVPSCTTIPFENIQLGNNDFLMGKVTNRTLSFADKIINTSSYPVTLDQMLTRIRLALDASADKLSITAVGSGTGFVQSFKYVNIAADGTLSGGKDSINTNNFTWVLNTDTVSSTAINGLAYTSDDKTVYVPDADYAYVPGSSTSKTNFHIHINELACSDTTWDGLDSYFNITLKQGVRYRVVAKLARIAFAGSNIYWNGSALTFDNVGASTTHKTYQGVYFKWGSLIGIAPNQSFSSSSTIYYTTNGNSWTSGTALAAGYSTYSSIATATNSADNDRSTNNLTYSSTNYTTGDICRAIYTVGSAPTTASGYTWRMATSKEMFVLTSSYSWTGASTYGFTKVGTSSAVTADDAGTTDITFGVQKSLWGGIFFPASGMIWNYDTALYDVGTAGYYWTGSATSYSTQAYSFNFDSSNFGTVQTSVESALPVRCVKVKQ